jgi:hypothetical protein
MKESKLMWMMKEVKQMQKVLMIMIERIEIIERKWFDEETNTEDNTE